MNTSNIKKYAPVARKQFRDAVMLKLTTLGIEADKKGNLQIAQATDLGDQVRYGQFSLDKALASRRERLVKRAEKQGYDVLVEHIAYTWFNRFCAIRYMELHGYLDHGFRMLSHPTLAGGFEVLDHVPEVADALGLDKVRLVEMKLAGDRDEELYRELLLAQCHALHGAMPFLFEAVNDEIELVLPDNLTRTDSILRGLVDTIPAEDWEQVEVIGWLYQFYISEKKDDVIGKVVKSEDIPAATQLFTPNWIVQYLVQNSVGRQWLQTYPDSSLKGKMPYYIEPAEQTSEVRAQLAAITPSSIGPESIKVLDPACGSGHILTEAYNVLKAIYEERGYRIRDIPQLILENNIFGLDIDDRAAQLSGFAMLMLARQDDRRILGRGVRLNIVSLQESKLDIAELWTKLNYHQQVQRGSMGDMFTEGTTLANADSAEYKLVMRILALFTSAKTLGSLIQVPHEDEAALKEFLDRLYRLAVEGDNQQKEAAAELIPYIQQAWILAQRYDAVVANPPYMGGKFQTPDVKKYLKDNFSGYEKDLFSAFIIRNLQLSKDGAQLGFMTPFVWMFISSYEQLRNRLINDEVITSLVQLEYSGFDGATVPICTFTLQKGHIADFTGSYIRLSEFRGAVNQGPRTLEAIKNHDCGWFFKAKPDDFKKIPGFPIAYWLDKNIQDTFSVSKKLNEIAKPLIGMRTGDNERFLRYWHEVSFLKCKFDCNDAGDAARSKEKWFPYQKGGEYRRWYGNLDYVVNWEENGREIKENTILNYPQLSWDNLGWKISNEKYYFKKAITWTATSSSYFGVRLSDEGFLFDVKGSFCCPNEDELYIYLGFLCSSFVNDMVKVLNPTIEIQPRDIGNLPYWGEGQVRNNEISDNVKHLIEISKDDWNSQERAWGFNRHALVKSENLKNLKESFDLLIECWSRTMSTLLELEEKNDHLFNEIFNFKSDGVKEEFLTLVCNPSYRYGGNLTKQEKNDRLYSDTISELLSYSIGCQMGRYSLDREGLVYAHEGNKGFSELVDEGTYQTFPADEDGILPLMDSDWFDDDVTSRVKEFVRTVWGEEHLQENLDFIAESLCLYAIKPKKGESSLDTIRRYLSTQFWKDHMKMYKKRPIYWLFSSGKEKAFECLVYLHRYNEGTLSRMRTEYVVPLLARYQGNIDLLNDQLKNAESGAATTRLKKELDGLTKKFNELRNFDDRLRHYADRRITIDLDDGVKVNYGKFGDLLADVKAITGSAPQEA
ncbi:BREX-1 system adenine-specific DNA-methyltransferase PglX [Salmonella enterica]|uniref:BREX-1 system adenine-specific DNA-methyltransferase PglX n=1 Tax=Salmonella enterica TaxID=28901 RepID=UPI0007C9469A|nr:BREX-1 system adenine-specific DNA-methyltransferase PglX [Salmonella enterica]EDQ2414442.1 BREX-1 system adenine-specific DNA-methyltransferase PglX [Salmonella enterica subsp. enterica serovar Ealing]ELG9728472.1 BREX-1 system adenine-specific DNA-methyltransferase PglX [Salmonella enterica subsp. enterica serovar Rough O:z29]EAB3336230.1 BREX-1 system adenine-specific DNA-methyltransferase PglX [Salmonella enterica]EAN5260519.1 BREX-1 system adenine-specific DNA-methyltransferase PglX [Sa